MNFTACTTDDGTKSAVEGELDSELDDLAGSEDSIDGDTTKTAEVDLDGETDLENNLQKDTQSSEDDEFLAEDLASPNSGSSGDADMMAESDLDKELNKSKEGDKKDEFADFPSAPVDEPAADKAPTTDVAGDDEFQATATPSAPPPVPEDPPISPASAEPVLGDAVAGDIPAAGAGTIITSKESTPGPEGFEFVNPAPLLPKDDLGESDPLTTEVDPPLPSLKAAQELVQVSKIDKNPFFVNERLMNTVYIARPNEDLGTISQKIYNEDRIANLLADNPTVSRGVAAGDKIYYTSPNRPDDKKAILTYYEDNKMAPAYYSTQQGDDIQKIGRRVLGFEDAWKEIWAINDGLQTQALLPAGLKIRYWSGNELKAGSSDAMSTPSTVESAPSVIPDKVETAEVPIDIPPSQDMGMVNTEDPGMASSSINAEPVPLLPDSSFAPPTTETPSVNQQNTGSLATMAGIAIVALAVLGLIAIQIKNRKRGDMGIPPSLEFTKV
jgi:hypothetical protein